MNLKNIIAIVQESRVLKIIETLQSENVPGASIMKVRGYGEYINNYSEDSLSENVRIEIMVESTRVRHAVNLIMSLTSSGMEGDGVIAVTPVEHLYRIRDRHQLF